MRHAPTAAEALLDAAITALSTLTPRDLLAAVGARELARRAGVSSGAFFHHFPSLDAFADALIARVYDPASLSGTATEQAGQRATAASAYPLEASLQMHAATLRHRAADPRYRLRIGLWALGGASVDEPYARFLRTTDARHEEATTQLLASWGRAPRAPMDVPSLLAAHTAFLQGAVLRHRIDPTLMTEERFALLVAALWVSSMRAHDDPRDLTDHLAEVNHYPHTRRRRAVGATPSRARDRLLAATDRLSAATPFQDLTLAAIARAAGVSVDALHDHFGGRAGLAFATLARVWTAQVQGMADGPTGQRRLLEAVARATSLRPSLAEAALPTVMSRDHARLVDRLLSPLIDPSGDREEDRLVARLLLCSTIWRQRQEPSSTPEQVVDAVLAPPPPRTSPRPAD